MRKPKTKYEIHDISTEGGSATLKDISEVAIHVQNKYKELCKTQ